MPALATWYARRYRYLKAYLIGALGYALGLAASLVSDLPSGATIVCAMTVVGIVLLALGPRVRPV